VPQILPRRLPLFPLQWLPQALSRTWRKHSFYEVLRWEQGEEANKGDWQIIGVSGAGPGRSEQVV
jgi:hypothetical protein